MKVADTRPETVPGHVVQFSYSRCCQLIGHNIDEETVTNILSNLDIVINSKDGDAWQLSVPAYRVDVTREADVVEEVLRIYGFNNIPIPSKLNSSIAYFPKPDAEKVQAVISEMLVGMGCMETMNNSLTKSSYITAFEGSQVKSDRNVEILNPLSHDLDIMRQSLIFNALETVGYNQNRQHSDLRLFEFGKIYQKFGEDYNENRRLLIVLTGRKRIENWNSSKEEFSYYSVKGMVNAVLTRLGLEGMLKEKASKNDLFTDGMQLSILKQKIGDIGWASAKLRKHFGIKNDVYIADLDWDAIIESLKFSKIKFSELPKTFEVRRDFSLLLDEKVKFSEIEEVALSCDNKLLKEVGLFDVYEGKNLEEGKKSYAVSFKFQDPEKTLQDKQIDAIMEKIRTQLESKLKAQLR